VINFGMYLLVLVAFVKELKRLLEMALARSVTVCLLLIIFLIALL